MFHDVSIGSGFVLYMLFFPINWSKLKKLDLGTKQRGLAFWDGGSIWF